jgi:ribonuclease Z
MAGQVFERAGARMSSIWHHAVDLETVGAVVREMRTEYDGSVVFAQDLTMFKSPKDAGIPRQATVDRLRGRSSASHARPDRLRSRTTRPPR